MKPYSLSPEQAAGQRIMAGFDGLEMNRDIEFLIEKVKVGGVILFRRNIKSPEQVQQLCSNIQAYARACGQPPLFIAIDQEGGTVARLPRPFTQFPNASDISSEAEAGRFARITAGELTSIGVNMNYAPVMDTAPKTMASIMAKRSFGDDPERVSRLGVTIIRHFQHNNIMAVAKHFPGIGRTTLDSHMDRPVFPTTIDELSEYDLIPFNAAIRNNVTGIMLSHILYDQLDPDWPASLSVIIARDLLRAQLGYKGLVMTDDLDMGAIKKYYPMDTVIDQVIKARIDQALICHQGPDIENAHSLLVSRIAKAEDPEDFELPIERIMAAKEKYLAV